MKRKDMHKLYNRAMRASDRLNQADSVEDGRTIRDLGDAMLSYYNAHRNAHKKVAKKRKAADRQYRKMFGTTGRVLPAGPDTEKKK